MSRKLFKLKIIFGLLSSIPCTSYAYSLSSTGSTLKKQRQQYYSHAGILPILDYKDKTYMVLGKIPGLKKTNFYGDFGGTQIKKDHNNPVWTAARNFSNRSSSSYEDIFALLKNQCLQTSCVLKANNGRYIVYPIEISLKNLDPLKRIDAAVDLLNNHQLYSFIELSLIKKQLATLNKDAVAKDLQIKINSGKLITIRSELIEALLDKPSFFERFKK